MKLLEAKDHAVLKLIDEGLEIFKNKDPNPQSETACKNILKELKIYHTLYEKIKE